MKVRPILFSGAMIRACLAGQKHETRRTIKNPDYFACLTGDCDHQEQAECDAFMATRSPYGVAGDLLWGREDVRGVELEDGTDGVRYSADQAFTPIENDPEAAIRWLKLHTYRGHSGSREGLEVRSMHMPRWVNRLTLDVEAIRAERLQQITDQGAFAEGYPGPRWRSKLEPAAPRLTDGCDAVHWYRSLWAVINGAESWDENPWVWVIRFDPIAKNVDTVIAERQR